MVYSSYYTCDENDSVTGLVKCRHRIPYWRIVCDNAVGFLTMMYDVKITGLEFLPEKRYIYRNAEYVVYTLYLLTFFHYYLTDLAEFHQ